MDKPVQLNLCVYASVGWVSFESRNALSCVRVKAFFRPTAFFLSWVLMKTIWLWTNGKKIIYENVLQNVWKMLAILIRFKYVIDVEPFADRPGTIQQISVVNCFLRKKCIDILCSMKWKDGTISEVIHMYSGRLSTLQITCIITCTINLWSAL